MTLPQPTYISREGLEVLLRQEVATLNGTESAWWSIHHVPPFAASHGSASHFVVAAAGERVLFFADDEDEFGIARFADTHSLTDCGLVGDLKDAIGVIQTIAGKPTDFTENRDSVSVDDQTSLPRRR